MGKTYEEISKRLKAILTEEFGLDASIDDEDGLFSNNILDSMDVLQLITIIENEYSVKIPVFEISIETLDSIKKTSDYILQLVNRE